ncbi:xyloglucan galactosyltransferase XLT2-like [Phragmites australis]|uniref:xyloglucan galactosyltransferase XLT2-like n=1 Tax=Phragmites australis TaxID=29695 RepID=UPI002D792431|nr:xyloglucan galactosyltransferase XLT2-like [Phragmites australis]
MLESTTSPATPPTPPGSPVDAATPSLVSALLRGSVLFLAFLAIQVVLFRSLLSFPSSRFLPVPGRSNTTWANGAVDAAACKAGLIYVYDLPLEFNHDLIDDCESLWPWYSFCPYLTNGGFGQPGATLPVFFNVTPNASLPSWYNTDQFPLEIIIHRRLLSHQCRTTDPSLATAFYVPFYAGLDVGSHLWGDNSTVADRDRAGLRLLRWLKNQTSFQRSGGWDHFITLGRITWDFRRYGDDGWGTNFVVMPGMENVTRLVIEADRLDPMDAGVPYPTGFHPRAAADVRAWQRYVLSRARSKLFGFAGAPRAGFRDDFRDVLLEECEDAGREYCRSVDCRGTRCTDNGVAVLELFLDSRFCLQPRGDSFTRRSLFDCMVAGAVPVLFWRRTAYDQYRWYLPAGSRGEEREWSVFIDRQALRVGNVSVRELLEGFSERQVRGMQERVVEMIPRLVYASSSDGLGDGMVDALDVALSGVLKRFQRRRWSIAREDRPPGPFGARRVNDKSTA